MNLIKWTPDSESTDKITQVQLFIIGSGCGIPTVSWNQSKCSFHK